MACVRCRSRRAGCSRVSLVVEKRGRRSALRKAKRKKIEVEVGSEGEGEEVMGPGPMGPEMVSSQSQRARRPVPRGEPAPFLRPPPSNARAGPSRLPPVTPWPSHSRTVMLNDEHLRGMLQRARHARWMVLDALQAVSELEQELSELREQVEGE